MRIERSEVSRRDLIIFYAKYDCQKKSKSLPSDLESWSWDDPDGLDQRLRAAHLKCGVLSGYRSWSLVELCVADLLECAIVNQIFPREPQALGRLLLRGRLAEWIPDRAADWWHQIGEGTLLGPESAFIIRRALSSEAGAKWYIEDGSGRAITLLQRILRYGEFGRTAWAYIGCEPDERSDFIKQNSELAGPLTPPSTACR